ncbi:MAG: secretion system protein F [Sphaerobacteraceae bacterium]|nr:MAG: secretion system protein F [Sphaerobacteraceae bacterium]
MDMFTLTILLIVIAVALLIVGILSQREGMASADVEERLERFGTHHSAAQQESDERDREESAIAGRVGKAVQNRDVGKSMATMLARADIKMTVGEFMLLRLGTTTGVGVLGFVLGRGFTEPLIGLLVGLGLGVIGWMGPHWWVSSVAKKRAKQFNDQLGDTIGLMANSLRAGYSLLQCMELASRETPEPMCIEFRRVVREMGLGISSQNAMQHMLDRVPSEDLDLLVTAINIQHEVGGNLAQILDVMGETIRERVRIKGEIAVLTSQGRISGYIITALPIGVAALLFVMNPEYMSALFVWPWICLPIAGIGFMVTGFIVMQKIVEIEV